MLDVMTLEKRRLLPRRHDRLHLLYVVLALLRARLKVMNLQQVKVILFVCISFTLPLHFCASVSRSQHEAGDW